MLKKFILSILVFLTVFVSLAPYATAKAQTWYNSNPMDWYIKVYDEEASPPTDIFGERYTAAQVQWVLWSLVSNLFNLPFTMLGLPVDTNVCLTKAFLDIVEPVDCFQSLADLLTAAGHKLVTDSSTTTSSALTQSGNSDSLFKMVFTQDRPISGISYVRNIGRKLKLVPEASAAETFGYSRLTVIKDFWAMSRNLAYFLFTLILIIISFMIMFKVKISPQAVISIQSALPKVFFTLILITFSFAIAGFLVDLVYVVMGIFSLFFSGTILNTPLNVYKFINGFGFGEFAIAAYLGFFLVLYDVAILLTFFAAVFSLNLTSALVAFLLMFFGILLTIIIIINFFIIIFALFKALAGFYVAVILGPLQLSLGALPQSSSTFGSWIKSMVSKLAVFPATGILFYLAVLFLLKAIEVSFVSLAGGNIVVDALQSFLALFNISWSPAIFGITPDNLWGPPMLANPETATSIALILIAIGILLIIPKISKAIESALAERPFDLEQAISQPIKQGAGTLGSYIEGFGHDMALKPRAGLVKSLGKIIQTLGR
ncbi:MAG: hypothetical protein Q8P91_00925 [bacterium]|nr:hypothetical protein [bacterium]